MTTNNYVEEKTEALLEAMQITSNPATRDLVRGFITDAIEQGRLEEKKRIIEWLEEEDSDFRKVGAAEDFFSEAKVVRVDHLLETLTPPISNKE